jgi:hypothetical protein
VVKVDVDADRPLFEVIFINGLILYVRFNYFDEYSYQIQFSHDKDDRIRYDNYDPTWDVSTKPHHVHVRGKQEGVDSPMTGDPGHDMPFLIKELKHYLQ